MPWSSTCRPIILSGSQPIVLCSKLQRSRGGCSKGKPMMPSMTWELTLSSPMWWSRRNRLGLVRSITHMQTSRSKIISRLSMQWHWDTGSHKRNWWVSVSRKKIAHIGNSRCPTLSPSLYTWWINNLEIARDSHLGSGRTSALRRGREMKSGNTVRRVSASPACHMPTIDYPLHQYWKYIGSVEVHWKPASKSSLCCWKKRCNGSCDSSATTKPHRLLKQPLEENWVEPWPMHASKWLHWWVNGRI